MTVRERKQLKILVVLLAILGLTLVFGPGINRPPTASVEPAAKVDGQQSPAPVSDARIRLDLADRSEEERVAGRENLFQYRTVRPTAPPPKMGGRGSDPFAAPPQQPVAPPVQPSRPAIPSVPAITLRYQGYARDDAATGGITAFLVDNAGPTGGEFSPHYNVKVGDLLLGRYRIISITTSTVDLEDLQYKRRQLLPLQQ